jgi:hypothetical protein
MWAQLFKVASMTKGALIVGVAASAAMVSNAEFSNTPSQHELPSATPISSVAPALRVTSSASSRPASSPSSPVEQKKSEVPVAQLPAATPPSSTVPTAPGAAALQHGAVPEVFKECVERYLAICEQGDAAPLADRQIVGEVCKAALSQSGLSGAEFWAKFGPEAQAIVPKTDAPIADLDTTRVLTPEVLGWVKACVTKYSRRAADATETCKKAIELTGFTSGQFAERYLWTTTTPKPETTTKPVTVTTDVSKLVAKCVELYKTVTSTSGDTKAVSEACGAAIKATGLTSSAFWAKYHPATATN